MNKTFAPSIRIAVLAISLPLAIVTAPAASLSTNAAAAEGGIGVDMVAERIGGAFASLPQTSVERVGADAVTLPPKGGRQRTSDCAGATWPNIDASCLSTADGSPAPHVRTITIGYQAGANATVLLRFPNADVAQR
jgi:hypothetical protein